MSEKWFGIMEVIALCAVALYCKDHIVAAIERQTEWLRGSGATAPVPNPPGDPSIDATSPSHTSSQ